MRLPHRLSGTSDTDEHPIIRVNSDGCVMQFDRNPLKSFALRGGGAEEIIDQNTGVFFDESSPEALDKAISILESKFKGNYRLKNSYVFDKFSEANFEKKFREAVGE
mgnify:CR=1 FL=1